MKRTNINAISLFLCLAIISCTQENNGETIADQEQELRTSLEISGKLPSSEEKESITSTVEPIFFDNVKDARKFIDGVSKEFSFNFTGEQIKDQLKKGSYANKGGSVSIDFDGGVSLLSVPCDSQFLDPHDGCEDGGGNNGSQGGCGSGNVRLTSGNQSFSFYYNATFNYNDQDGSVSASDFNSYTSGLTIGTSYDHISSNHSVAADGTINFTVRGALHYNIFVEGVGTIYTENITLLGQYNPCSGNGGLELYLEPAN